MVVQVGKPMFCDDFEASPPAAPTPAPDVSPPPAIEHNADASVLGTALMRWAGGATLAVAVVLCVALTLTVAAHAPRSSQERGFQGSGAGAPSATIRPGDSSTASGRSGTPGTVPSQIGLNDQRVQDRTAWTGIRYPVATASAESATAVGQLSDHAAGDQGRPTAKAKPAGKKPRNPRAAPPGGRAHAHG